MNTTMNDRKTNNDNVNVKNTNNSNVNTNRNDDSKLREFFNDQLKDIYWAEQTLVKTLPKMQEAATSSELKNAFSQHLDQTKQQVQRLEKVFNIIGVKPEAVKCDAMAGIVKEGENIIGETDGNTAQRDVGLIFAGQKAEHYEIATYGGLVTLAKTLGFPEAANLLNQTLTEEKEADVRLTEIATQSANRKASRETAEALN